MKTILAFALFTLCVTRSLAAIPERLGGYVLKTSRYQYHDVSRDALQFAADETWQELYSYGGLLGSQPLLFREPKLSGTYTYTKLDESNAALVLSVNSKPWSPIPLHFITDTTGVFSDGSYTAFELSRLDDLPPLVNCSNRSYLRVGSTAFAGLVVQKPCVVLARAVGPGLARFGITDALARPVLRAREAKYQSLVAENKGWTDSTPTAINRVSAVVGAFPLANDSKDAASLLMLTPGAYICEVSSADPAASGEAMIEVYLLP